MFYSSFYGLFYTFRILSITIPPIPNAEKAIIERDQRGIYVSSGSAFDAGAASHVLAAVEALAEILQV